MSIQHSLCGSSRRAASHRTARDAGQRRSTYRATGAAGACKGGGCSGGAAPGAEGAPHDKTRLATDDTERLRLFKTAQNEKIVGFYREGLPVREIARRVSLHHSTVVRRLKALQHQPPPPPPPALDARAAPGARDAARELAAAADAALFGDDARAADDAPGAARALDEFNGRLGLDDGFGIDDDGMDDARADGVALTAPSADPPRLFTPLA